MGGSYVAAVSGRDEVGDQHAVAGCVLAQAHHGFGDGIMSTQRDFDLFELNAISMQLDLVVDPVAIVEPAVGQVAHDITGPVHDGAAVRSERIGDEPGPRQLRFAEVTRGHAVATDVELAGYSRRHRLHPPVENVEPGVGDRSPDRDLPARDLAEGPGPVSGPRIRHEPRRLHEVDRGPDCRLGRPVEVPHLPGAREQAVGEVPG